MQYLDVREKAILEAVGSSASGLSAYQIAARTKLSEASLKPYLRSMAEEGLIHRKSGNYCISPELREEFPCAAPARWLGKSTAQTNPKNTGPAL